MVYMLQEVTSDDSGKECQSWLGECGPSDAALNAVGNWSIKLHLYLI